MMKKKKNLCVRKKAEKFFFSFFSFDRQKKKSKKQQTQVRKNLRGEVRWERDEERARFDSIEPRKFPLEFIITQTERDDVLAAFETRRLFQRRRRCR